MSPSALPTLPSGARLYQKLGFEQFFETDRDGPDTEAFLKGQRSQFIELVPS